MTTQILEAPARPNAAIRIETNQRRISKRRDAQWLVLVFWLLSATLCSRANAQSYTIDWFTIDGGGGTSTGGAFSVSGTVGQPNTGAMSGGSFTVIGGFWPGMVSEPGVLPRLHIRWVGTDVVLGWPHSSLGYQLQQDTPGGWTDVTQTPVRAGDNNEVTVSIDTPYRFFRLRRL